MSEEASSSSRDDRPLSPPPAKPMAAATAAAAQVDPRVEFERRLVPEILGAERFRAMLAQGLVDEVVGLRARYALDAGLPSMRAVGYRQV